MNFKRLFSLLLVLCFAAMCLVACKDEAETSSQSAGNRPGLSEYQDADGNYIGATSGKTYEGETITFLTNNTVSVYESEIICNVGTFYEEGADMTFPQVINDDLKYRQEYVEEKLGVTIEEIQVHSPNRYNGDMLAEVVRGNLSSTEDYQVIAPCLYDGASLAVDDHLYNLLGADVEGLQIEAPWWNQEFNENMTYAGQLYFTIGDIGLTNKSCTSAMYFNLDVWNKYSLSDTYGGSPYDLVRDGKWTIDVAFESAKLISNDLDNNGIINYKDEYGWSGQKDDMWSIFFGSGERVASHDADGYPTITVYTERSAKVMDALQEFVQGTGYYVSANDFFGLSSTPEDLTRDAFISGRNLYFNAALGSVIALGDMEQHFGVVPEPKFNKDQEDYYSLVNPWGSTCFAIPVCVTGEKLQMTVDVLNVMGAVSKNTLAKNYQETVLSYMKTRDDESAEMINEYIIPTRACDVGMVYSWGKMDWLLQDMEDLPKGTFASEVEKRMDAAETALEKTIQFYKSKENAA